MTDLLKLVKTLYPKSKLLTQDQVQQLMIDHARLPGLSGRKAAEEIGVSATYWHSAITGKQLPGDKIAAGYHLRHVDRWEIVED